MRIPITFLAFSAILTFFTAGAAIPQPSYSIREVNSDPSVFAAGINDSGQIVGSFVVGGAARAFLFHNGVITNLGTLGGSRSEADAISSNGKIVGQAANASNNLRAFLSDNGGPLTDLGTLGGSVSWGHAVNDSGQVAGYSWPTGLNQRRAISCSGGTMTNLGVLTGGNSSTAYGINEAGQIVGEGNTSTPNGTWIHAFTYSGGAMTDIGTLGGNVSGARDINNRGEIVGYAYPPSGGPHAFRYRNGVMTDLGVLPGDVACQANATNDAGKVIGFSRFTDQSQRAVIHRAGRLQTLVSLIPTGSGWTLNDATGISESGMIVGTGRLNNANRSFILTPLYTLTPSAVSTNPGQSLSILWSAPAGSPTLDWIGLYKVGDPDGTFRWWTYTNGTAGGSADLTAPSQPGEYEFRYFYSNGYRLQEVSAPITVSGDSATATLTVSSTSVFIGDPLSVNWTVNAGRPASDWIGLFQVGSPNNAYGWWRYTGGATSGTFDLTAPLEPGQYEFRYLLNNGYVDAARSPAVTVNQPGSGYSVSASPAAVPPGGAVTVQWTAPAGSSPNDWIALYPEGEPQNRNYLWPHWFYTGGAATGSRSLVMPNTPGKYVLRYLLNNGYTHAAESGVLTVQ